VEIRVESLGAAVGKRLQKPEAIAVPPDVVANGFGLGPVANHEILASDTRLRSRTGGNGFLMVVLAMDQ